MDPTATFYSRPTYVGHGGIPIFTGARRMRGGSVLGSLAKVVVPALKSLGSAAVRAVGRQAVGLAQDVASSIGRGQGWRGAARTLKNQGVKRLKIASAQTIKSQLPSVVSEVAGLVAPTVASPPLRKRATKRSANSLLGNSTVGPVKRRRTVANRRRRTVKNF